MCNAVNRFCFVFFFSLLFCSFSLHICTQKRDRSKSIHTHTHARKHTALYYVYLYLRYSGARGGLKNEINNKTLLPCTYIGMNDDDDDDVKNWPICSSITHLTSRAYSVFDRSRNNFPQNINDSLSEFFRHKV